MVSSSSVNHHYTAQNNVKNTQTQPPYHNRCNPCICFTCSHAFLVSFNRFILPSLTSTFTPKPSLDFHHSNLLPSGKILYVVARAGSPRRSKSSSSNWKNLAEPAKQKRVLTLLDFWFGQVNLPTDDFIHKQLAKGNGWMSINALMTFPKLQAFASVNTVLNTLRGSVGSKRYELLESGTSTGSSNSLMAIAGLNRSQTHQVLKNGAAFTSASFRPRAFAKKYDALIPGIGNENQWLGTDSAWKFNATLQQLIQLNQDLGGYSRSYFNDIIAKLKKKGLIAILSSLPVDEILAIARMEEAVLNFHDPVIVRVLRALHPQVVYDIIEHYDLDFYSHPSTLDFELVIHKVSATYNLSPQDLYNFLRNALDSSSSHPRADSIRQAYDLLPRQTEFETACPGLRRKAFVEALERDLTTSELRRLVLLSNCDLIGQESRESVIDSILYHAKDVNPFALAAVKKAAGASSNEVIDQDILDSNIADTFHADADLNSQKKSDSKRAKERRVKEERAKDDTLELFCFTGKVYVVTKYDHVDKLCNILLKSLYNDFDASQKTATQDDRYTRSPALAIDVEYATLDTDLRMLPALMQIAVPGIVGLLWLDKMPRNGKDLLKKSKVLPKLLQDKKIAKVGIGIISDILSVLEWCDDSEIEGRGVIDLAKSVNYVPPTQLRQMFENNHNHLDPAENASSPSPYKGKLDLATWCQYLLRSNLPKRKFRGHKSSKAAKLSHWRADVLSKNMQRYAVEDAAASLAVYKELCSRLDLRAKFVYKDQPDQLVKLIIPTRVYLGEPRIPDTVDTVAVNDDEFQANSDTGEERGPLDSVDDIPITTDTRQELEFSQTAAKSVSDTSNHDDDTTLDEYIFRA